MILNSIMNCRMNQINCRRVFSPFKSSNYHPLKNDFIILSTLKIFKIVYLSINKYTIMCISTLGYCPIDVYSSKPLLTKVRLNREKDITDLIKQNKSSSNHLSYPKVP